MFTIAPVASPIHDEASLKRLVDVYRPAFESIGGSLDETDGPTLPFVLTGGTEAQILERWDADEPLFLIAHPDQNSLPSSLEALARVGQLGGRGKILYLSGIDDRNGLDEIAAAVHDLSVYRQMRRQTIGVVGPPSDWLVASMPSAEVLKASWGPTAVPIGLDRLYGAYTTEPDIEPIPAGETRIEIGEVAKADGIYKGLRELISGENLDALSLRCFDVIGELDTTGCLALARLNDEGTIAGCEGDLVSTTHYESDRGVGMHGDFARGPITVVRVGGNRMERLWLAEGEILRPGDEPDLCRTQVEIRLEDGAADQLLSDPLGNHLVMIRGHHANRLRSWWKTMVAPRP